MERLYRGWEEPRSTFGNLAVIGFLLVQSLDGIFTYLGVSIWGPDIEANPIVGLAMTVGGPAPGLASLKLIAIAFGIALHLRRAHTVVAFLTIVYIAVAILPWTAMFLAH
jgi:hypothetical protein